MVLVKKTQTQLKFIYRPYLVWVGTSGLIFGVPLFIKLISINEGWIIYLWWMPLFFPAVILIGILGLLFAGHVITYQFDKDYDTLTIKQRGLLNSKMIWYSLGEIFDVQLQSTSWNPEETVNYQIVIVLKAGNSFPLNLGFNSPREKLEIVNLIRKFLGMSPQNLG